MSDPQTLTVEIREVGEQPYLGKRFTASLDRIGQEVPAAYRELYTRLAETGIAPAAPPFLVASMPQHGTMEVEAGVPCAAPPSPTKGLVAGTLPAGRVAVAVHRGSYDSIAPTYQALSGWILEHGHAMAGPPREVYLTGTDEVPSPEFYVTEVVWPIR